MDLNGEVLFVSPFPRAWAEGLPNRWAWVAAPRVHLGAAPNLGGYTSKVYAGLTWTAALARDVMWAGDALRFDFFFGGSLHDGKLETDDPKRRALGSAGLFRVGAEIGWQATPRWSVSAFFDHDSNGNLAPPNGSLNSYGLRLGLAF
ncbi:MAG: acyloxyacyl hydrolase [Acetobacteraceae bacterium]|nr:acyloxyacyl hydrolase [Acetobacteraceae bacterium]